MDLKEIIKKRVDLEGLIMEDVLSGMVWKKLEELAADSSNPLDDAVLEFVRPLVDEYVREELKKLLESALGPESAPAAE
jgi:hypothetical protein